MDIGGRASPSFSPDSMLSVCRRRNASAPERPGNSSFAANADAPAIGRPSSSRPSPKLVLVLLAVAVSTAADRTLVFDIASVVVLASIAAHGLTDTVGARWIERRLRD